MDKVLPFTKPAKPISSVIFKEDLLMKCYGDKRVNNCCIELLMTVDKVLRENGWEFNSASDRDYITDETHKFMLNFIRPYIRKIP